MHVIMTPVGSAGDVLPHVALGQALRKRGHEVVVLANEHFQGMIEEADLEFVQVGTAASYAAIMDQTDLSNPHRVGRLLLQHLLALMPRTFHAILEHARPGESVLVCSLSDFGAPLAGEKKNLPVARLAVEPTSLPSTYNPMLTPGMRRMDWIPDWLLRKPTSLAVWLFGREVRRRLDEFREEIELPPIRTSILAWWQAPPVIGLFPEWFALYRQDRSESTPLTGFLRYRREEGVKTPRELADFLDGGPPPMVFTVASFNTQAHEYFSVAVNVAERIGGRAVLVTPHRAQIPSDLPANVVHFDYVPFADILSRCAVLVHNGGIGTLAEALVAGTPQLIVPYFGAHFDHAMRLRDLGAGDYIVGRKFGDRSLSEKLTSILENESFRQNAQRCSELIAKQDAEDETCRLVEELDRAAAVRG